MQARSIIFIGPQGSGKGTQVEKLIGYLNENDPSHKIVEVQTGRGFRELAEGDSYTAYRIKNILEHGNLVPDFLTEAVVVNQLIADLTSDSHLIMDGFPRNLGQAAFVDDVLAFYLREQLDVVYLETPEDVVRQRMLARGRSDDNEESINERLRLYKEMTEPLLAHFKQRPNTNFVVVDGSGTVDEVHDAVRAGLEV